VNRKIKTIALNAIAPAIAILAGGGGGYYAKSQANRAIKMFSDQEKRVKRLEQFMVKDLNFFDSRDPKVQKNVMGFVLDKMANGESLLDVKNNTKDIKETKKIK
jgi:hypothetical protein